MTATDSGLPTLLVPLGLIGRSLQFDAKLRVQRVPLPSWNQGNIDGVFLFIQAIFVNRQYHEVRVYCQQLCLVLSTIILLGILAVT